MSLECEMTLVVKSILIESAISNVIELLETGILWIFHIFFNFTFEIFRIKQGSEFNSPWRLLYNNKTIQPQKSNFVIWNLFIHIIDLYCSISITKDFHSMANKLCKTVKSPFFGSAKSFLCQIFQKSKRIKSSIWHSWKFKVFAYCV